MANLPDEVNNMEMIMERNLTTKLEDLDPFVIAELITIALRSIVREFNVPI